ncbi:MAG: hypothetical protein Q3976_04390 [Corynebacterium sp.]|nr:hypothetical protein [Corynebacterium sp.]
MNLNDVFNILVQYAPENLPLFFSGALDTSDWFQRLLNMFPDLAVFF